MDLQTEIIEYPSRAKAVEALLRFRSNPAVKAIELRGVGKVLRVTIDADAVEVDEGSLDGEETQTPLVEGEAGSEGSGSESGGEASADASDTRDPDTEPEAEPFDVTVLDSYNRAQLREFAESRGLDVKIPKTGPLEPIRDRIAAALNT